MPKTWLNRSKRAEITGKTIAVAWAQIVETPDELLVDLISENHRAHLRVQAGAGAG